jgi:hypothetical protein
VTKTERNAALIAIIVVGLAIAYAVGRLSDRISVLEKRCLAQCEYGDHDCIRMCAKVGHCPFQEMP